MNALLKQSLCTLALVTSLGACKKKSDTTAAPAGSGSSAPATNVAKPVAGAALASTVKYVDPKFVMTNKEETFDFSGTPQLHVDKQPDSDDYIYELRMFPPGAKVDCDTAVTFVKTLPGDRALVVDLGRKDSAPKAGLELEGSYELHFLDEKKSPTTNGVLHGAKVKITAVAGKTASGELDAKADGNGQPTAKGTFTAQLCGWPEDEANGSDGNGSDGSGNSE